MARKATEGVRVGRANLKQKMAERAAAEQRKAEALSAHQVDPLGVEVDSAAKAARSTTLVIGGAKAGRVWHKRPPVEEAAPKGHADKNGHEYPVFRMRRDLAASNARLRDEVRKAREGHKAREKAIRDYYAALHAAEEVVRIGRADLARLGIAPADA